MTLLLVYVILAWLPSLLITTYFFFCLHLQIKTILGQKINILLATLQLLINFVISMDTSSH